MKFTVMIGDNSEFCLKFNLFAGGLYVHGPLFLGITDSGSRFELMSCTVGPDSQDHYYSEYWTAVDLSQKSSVSIHLNFVVVHPPA